MGKQFINKMSDKIVEKFPDPVNLNSLFEVAQAMWDQGKEKKEIKKILKDLYGASKDELERLEEKLFKNKINASQESDEAVREELATVRNEMHDLIGRLEFLEGNIPATQSDLESKIYDIVKEFDNGFQLLNKLVESLTKPEEPSEE